MKAAHAVDQVPDHEKMCSGALVVLTIGLKRRQKENIDDSLLGHKCQSLQVSTKQLNSFRMEVFWCIKSLDVMTSHVFHPARHCRQERIHVQLIGKAIRDHTAGCQSVAGDGFACARRRRMVDISESSFTPYLNEIAGDL
jgi:hypothetical protein